MSRMTDGIADREMPCACREFTGATRPVSEFWIPYHWDHANHVCCGLLQVGQFAVRTTTSFDAKRRTLRISVVGDMKRPITDEEFLTAIRAASCSRATRLVHQPPDTSFRLEAVAFIGDVASASRAARYLLHDLKRTLADPQIAAMFGLQTYEENPR